jgi:hypothetical protein
MDPIRTDLAGSPLPSAEVASLVDANNGATGQRVFTGEEVCEAVNRGAELVVHDDGLWLSDRDHDLINLLVNVIGSALDHPGDGLTLDKAIEDSYGADPAEVRSWIN